MQSTRRLSVVLAAAAAACLAFASNIVDTCRRAVSVATAYVVDSLVLFAAPDHVAQVQPDVPTGLTARQRHDLNDGPTMRPTMSPRWRMCPST